MWVKTHAGNAVNLDHAMRLRADRAYGGTYYSLCADFLSDGKEISVYLETGLQSEYEVQKIIEALTAPVSAFDVYLQSLKQVEGENDVD